MKEVRLLPEAPSGSSVELKCLVLQISGPSLPAAPGGTRSQGRNMSKHILDNPKIYLRPHVLHNGSILHLRCPVDCHGEKRASFFGWWSLKENPSPKQATKGAAESPKPGFPRLMRALRAWNSLPEVVSKTVPRKLKKNTRGALAVLPFLKRGAFRYFHVLKTILKGNLSPTGDNTSYFLSKWKGCCFWVSP